MEILYLSEGPNRRQLQLKDVVEVEWWDTKQERQPKARHRGRALDLIQVKPFKGL
jgi:hypothetical protein